MQEQAASAEHIDSEGSHGLFCSNCERYLAHDLSALPKRCPGCNRRIVDRPKPSD